MHMHIKLMNTFGNWLIWAIVKRRCSEARTITVSLAVFQRLPGIMPMDLIVL